MLGTYIVFFVLGTIIGSFLNVIVCRLKTKELFFKKRSHCPFCKKKLSWYELIPIFSFIIQKGKCRNCNKKISWQYPLVEFFAGLTFILIAVYFFDFSLSSIITTCFLFLVSCFLLVIFVYDLKYYLIPDTIIYPAILIAFIYGLFRIWNFGNWDLSGIWSLGLGALIGGVFFLIIVLISKGKWMGIGDVKIGILMGLLLGLSGLLVALFLAFLGGAIISIVLLILKKKKLKSEIPLGPFLTAATFIALLWGDILMRWYFNLFM